MFILSVFQEETPTEQAVAEAHRVDAQEPTSTSLQESSSSTTSAYCPPQASPEGPALYPE